MMTVTGPDISVYVTTANGLPKPDWEAIAARIKLIAGPRERFATWTDVVRQWMDRMCSTLGDGYETAESEHFLVMLPTSVPRDVFLGFVEQCRLRLLDALPDVGAFSAPGKEALLVFHDGFACEKYLSMWWDDTDRFRIGAQVRGGYPHVAATGANYDVLEDILAHELTHLSLCHLPLPQWIDEGLAQMFSQDATGLCILQMTPQAVRQQKEYWRRHGLSEFWYGEGFHKADDDRCAMCYDLAEILVRLLIVDHRPQWFGLSRKRQQRLCAFVSEADRSDAGEAAARKHLGFGIADLAGKFLGPGNWSPETGREPVSDERP